MQIISHFSFRFNSQPHIVQYNQRISFCVLFADTREFEPCEPSMRSINKLVSKKWRERMPLGLPSLLVGHATFNPWIAHTLADIFSHYERWLNQALKQF